MEVKPARRSLTGRWTNAERERFTKAYRKFGKNWVEVQKIVKTRSLTQVRSHAQKYFLALGKHGAEGLSDTEDSQAIVYQEQSEDETSNCCSDSKNREPDQRQADRLGNRAQSDSNQNKIEETASCSGVENYHLPAAQGSLKVHLKKQLQRYVEQQQKPSQFMKILARNFQFFSRGGDFLQMCQIFN